MVPQHQDQRRFAKLYSDGGRYQRNAVTHTHLHTHTLAHSHCILDKAAMGETDHRTMAACCVLATMATWTQDPPGKRSWVKL